MQVTVKMFATLRDYLPPDTKGSEVAMELPEGMTVKDLLVKLEVPIDIKLFTLVNAAHADLGRTLQNGDVLAVFPPIGGG